MKTYKTTEVAKIIGIHANTVRLYEKYELIPKPERLKNGYRVFTELHLEQFRLARAALSVELLQNGLRKLAVDIIKTAARGEYDEARQKTDCYLKQVETEIQNAEEAICIAKQLMSRPAAPKPSGTVRLTRREAAEYLGITMDTLRNWELNGLITVKRGQNGYRIYQDGDLKRLKVIRTLRCANYSLTAILRMLLALAENPASDPGKVLNTPEQDEDIITACDKLLASLTEAKLNMLYVTAQIMRMEQMRK